MWDGSKQFDREKLPVATLAITKSRVQRIPSLRRTSAFGPFRKLLVRLSLTLSPVTFSEYLPFGETRGIQGCESGKGQYFIERQAFRAGKFIRTWESSWEMSGIIMLHCLIGFYFFALMWFQLNILFVTYIVQENNEDLRTYYLYFLLFDAISTVNYFSLILLLFIAY